MRLRRAATFAAVPWVALLAAFSWGAAVRVAAADHYHTNCVGHGFVHGESLTDASFHSRVEAGCGSSWRWCDLYSASGYIGGSSASGGSATCNAWSKNYGIYVECASSARVGADVLSDHYHRAHNWCG